MRVLGLSSVGCELARFCLSEAVDYVESSQILAMSAMAIAVDWPDYVPPRHGPEWSCAFAWVAWRETSLENSGFNLGNISLESLDKPGTGNTRQRPRPLGPSSQYLRKRDPAISLSSAMTGRASYFGESLAATTFKVAQRLATMSRPVVPKILAPRCVPRNMQFLGSLLVTSSGIFGCVIFYLN